MGQPVVHFEVNARDGKRAQDFYAALFQWNINADNPMNYGLVNTGSKTGINGGVSQVQEGTFPFVTFYVEVDDPQSYLDRAVTLGGKVIVPVTHIPDMVTFAQFADPEGLAIGLVKSAEPKPKKRKPKKIKRARRKSRGRKR